VIGPTCRGIRFKQFSNKRKKAWKEEPIINNLVGKKMEERPKLRRVKLRITQ